MGIEETRRAIENLAKGRGDRAARLWSLFSRFHPETDPTRAFYTLKAHRGVLPWEFREEARQLIKDIENLLKTPPLP